ncbi:hypothetical protein GCM10008022_03620 [Paenibacillus hunanensis]|nr:hypothetical protein GCM10008022_03620 [Paenibacillus hunanensis]
MTVHGFVSYSMERAYAAYKLGKITRCEYCNRLAYLISLH